MERRKTLIFTENYLESKEHPMRTQACSALLWSSSGVLALRKVELVRITWADSGPLAKVLY
jgi:hypothetical protein